MSATGETTNSYDGHREDTVAAVASGVGACGIAVIRISGPSAFDITDRIFVGSQETAGFDSHTVHYGTLVSPDSRDHIDDVLVTVFKSPTSYTGEDVVEISCHGGGVTVRRALEAVFRSGAAPAGPGEFTKRAFLNGRLDLAQAEAVNDLIRAQTEESQRLALSQLEGTLSRKVAGVSDAILSTLAGMEAAIDFPEDVPEPDMDDVELRVAEAIAVLEGLVATSRRGRVYREGISLAIVGRPNVGKSSLLNALLRGSRAIVTAIPGTTRDVIEETININGIPVVAADTAGLRATDDEVERIGVELTERTMSAAHIVLVVIDAQEGVTDDDLAIIDRTPSISLIAINKIDLVSTESIDKLRETLPERKVIPISAPDGEGITELEECIAEIALSGEAEAHESVVVTNARHAQSLGHALGSLRHVQEGISSGAQIDLLTADLYAARESLGEITGDTATEDLVDRIFHDFCIGK